MKRVLVTGAEGLLGSSLLPHLRARGHEVMGHSRRTSAHADLAEPGQAFAVLDEAVPDVIVNLAALANVDQCESQPQSAYLANVRLVENLASWAGGRVGACHLVQISTDQVYDGARVHEESEVSLTNYYGFSKYAGELAASVIPSTVLRTNFFGPSLCAGKKSISDWLFQSLQEKKSITVFDDIMFSPLSLERLVEFIELAVERQKPGIYNLGSKEGMSKADFAFTFAEAMDLPVDSMFRGDSSSVKLGAYRPRDMRMNSSRFEKAFDIRLPTLKEEIKLMGAAYEKAR